MATSNIVEVPIEFLRFFQEEPERSMLEYLSIPVGSTNPFFRNFLKIREATERSKQYPNPIDWNTYLFNEDFVAQDTKPRYMHIDLAINRDAVGISMCHAHSFIKKRVKIPWRSEEVQAMVPIIKFDFVARLGPRKEYAERDMNFNALLSMIEDLAFTRKFNLLDGLITFDRFQSHMMIQHIRNLNIPCALLSVDHTTAALIVDFEKDGMIRREPLHKQPAAAMGALRDAYYQDRIILVDMPMFDDYRNWLEKEADEVQWDIEKQKAVKMEGGSDDLIQSIAGAAFHCVNNATEEISFADHENSEPQIREQEFWEGIGRDPTKGQANGDGYIEDNFTAYGDRQGGREWGINDAGQFYKSDLLGR